MKRLIALAMALLMLGLAACGQVKTASPDPTPSPREQEEPAATAEPAPEETAEAPAEESETVTEAEEPEEEAPAGNEPLAEEPFFTEDTRILDVIADPAFEGFGDLLFPNFKNEPIEWNIRDNWCLRETYNLLFGYKHVNSEVIVEELNAMKSAVQAGETIFYEIYTDEEKAADPRKEDTGLFFFRGEPGAKTAVLCPGGAFHYVASIQDSFPQALDLSKKGFNAFALVYRPGARSGCEDLSRAVAWLHDHAEELQIDMTDYSLWGGSVGGRLAAWVGRYGTEFFGEKACPRGCVVIQQYTALYGADGNDLPTYINIGMRDTHAYPGNVTLRVNSLNAVGVETELEMFETLYHGYNIGRGTEAEGWVDRAIAFWERHMSS